MSTTHQRRDAHSFHPMPVVYWNHDCLGDGMVVEMMPDGVRLVGTYLAATGTPVRLRLSLPGNPTPLYVPRAVVREVRERVLRVEFLTVPDEDQARLNAFGWKQRPTHSMASDHRTDRQQSSTSKEGARSMAHILVIDDEESIQRALRFMLEGAGHEVTAASNGRLGLAAYRAKPADLVITDLRMPEMNGLDLILKLTQTFLNVKVLAISGAPDREPALNTAKLLGVRHTLQKPFSRDVLLKAVDYELAH